MIISEASLRKLIRKTLIESTRLDEINPSIDRMTGGGAESFGKAHKGFSKISDKDFINAVSDLGIEFSKGTVDASVIAASFLDPTGITAIPDIAPALMTYQKNKTLINLGLLILSVLAVAPIAGKLAKVGAKGLKSIKAALTGAKNAGKVPGGLKKVTDNAIEAIDEAASTSAKSTSKTGSSGKNKNILTKANALTKISNSRKKIESFTLGETYVLDEDLYVFMATYSGRTKKIQPGGKISKSKGMGKHSGKANEAEEILEAQRKIFAPDAVSRTDSIYTSPYADAGSWSRTYGDNINVVMIPKGSKVTFVDGQAATEVQGKLKEMHGSVGDAKEYADQYWTGSRMSADNELYEELLTNGDAVVVGNAKELLDPEEISKLSKKVAWDNSKHKRLTSADELPEYDKAGNPVWFDYKTGKDRPWSERPK